MSEVRISLAIMHLATRPHRRALVLDQMRQLGGVERLNKETEYWEVTKDHLAVGPWPTARRGWLAYQHAPNATHHVLLQDDAVLCKDLVEGLKKALAEIPPAAVSLFNNRPATLEAKASGRHWVSLPGGVHGQGIVLPVQWIPEFLLWVDQHIPPDYLHDDRRLSLWLMQHQKLSLATAPTLVDHGAADKSTLGHNDGTYVSKWFIGVDGSPLDIDWSAGSSNPVVSRPRFTLQQRWDDVARATSRVSDAKKKRVAKRLAGYTRGST